VIILFPSSSFGLISWTPPLFSNADCSYCIDRPLPETPQKSVPISTLLRASLPVLCPPPFFPSTGLPPHDRFLFKSVISMSIVTKGNGVAPQRSSSHLPEYSPLYRLTNSLPVLLSCASRFISPLSWLDPFSSPQQFRFSSFGRCLVTPCCPPTCSRRLPKSH